MLHETKLFFSSEHFNFNKECSEKKLFRSVLFLMTFLSLLLHVYFFYFHGVEAINLFSPDVFFLTGDDWLIFISKLFIGFVAFVFFVLSICLLTSILMFLVLNSIYLFRSIRLLLN